MERVNELITGAYIRAEIGTHSLLFPAGIVLLLLGSYEETFAAGTAKMACGVLLKYVEGPFGALITAAAGIGAIVAAALGGFKVAWTLVVTAVGAFILRSYMTLWFGDTCTF